MYCEVIRMKSLGVLSMLAKKVHKHKAHTFLRQRKKRSSYILSQVKSLPI